MKLSLLAAALLIAAVTCISLTTHDRTLSNKFKLKFDYAAAEGHPLATSALIVYWNSKKIFEITPKDYEVHAVKLEVEAKVGENVLNFVGDGPSDGHGAAIDNVELIRNGKCGHEDVLVNGDFHDGYKLTWGKMIFYDGIPGWRGNEIEIGPGKAFNKHWPHHNPVCELDGDANVDMYQSIVFDEEFEQVSDEQA